MINYISAFLAALVTSLILTPVVRMWALKKEWVARPQKDRWHQQTTALMGGIAIFGGLSTAMVVFGNLHTTVVDVFFQRVDEPLAMLPLVVFGGATILFIIGLTDDFINLKPQSKLVGQIVVASIVTFLGFRLNWFNSLTLDTMVTLVWIVGITNAFNLLDNMDGLCSGVALVTSLALAVLYAPMHSMATVVALIVAGACGGFLVYNFKPASIFMGDCGSLVIGFSIAVLTLVHGQIAGANRLATLCVPIMLLMVPILDTTLVTIIRLLSGRKASTGGWDHTSHRLVLMGFGEKDAVLLLYGVGAVSGVAAIFVSRNDTMTSPAVIIPVILAILLMGIYLAQLRVYPEKEFSVLRNRKFTPVLIELTYKRQILMVVLDFGLVAFSYYLAYRLRFAGPDFPYYFKVFLKFLPAIIAVKLIVFYLSGVYGGFWQYISTRDVFLYARSSFLATLLTIACVTILYGFNDFSKGVFVIDYVLTTVFLLGTRGAFRLLSETMKRKTLTGQRVAIYGAGRGGELLLRELLNNRTHHVKPIGFVDDDPLKVGKKIQGFPIMGSFNDMSRLTKAHDIQGLLLSFNGNGDALAAARRYCLENGLFLKTFSIHIDPVDLGDLR
ncbi:MAG: glycosyl transferase [Proteobacteria bacterium]|nr:MAG: glycosyl transferase [Pseudomonadota bacterium]PIE67691.1 MAG: glycosyl transferase [Deltaproteobacteria bacterium]